jgi:hypothetical protein
MEKTVTRLAAVVPWFTSLALPVLSACAPGLASGGEPSGAFQTDDGGSPSLVVGPEAGLTEGAVPEGGEDGGDRAADGPCERGADAAADAPPAEASDDASDDAPPSPPMQPSCPTGHVVCGNACVDLQTDPINCGACGRACTPGGCASGACQPWVVVSGVDPAGIACDGVNLVWANVASADVYQVPADGSANGGGAAATVTLSTPGSDPVVAIAMEGSTVVWATLNSSTQQSTLYTGVESAVYSGVAVGAPLDPVSGLALDAYGAYAYLATAGSVATGTIGQCSVAAISPSCASIASVASSRLGQVAVDDRNVYFTDPANAFVSRYGLGDRRVVNVATGQKGLTAIALDDASVYWVTSYGGPSSISGMSKLSPGAPSLLATSAGYATALATDGANLYVAASGVIASVPVTGGSLATRYAAANPVTSAITQIVYAAGAIYWGDGGPQAIYGLRVP